MPMIRALTSSFERALSNLQQRRLREEEERRTEFQWARQMRDRSEPGSVDYRYWHAIVVQRAEQIL